MKLARSAGQGAIEQGAHSASHIQLLRGQGATEYLVLLAVVLIIGLVSVALLGFFPGISGGISEAESQAYWGGVARPIKINGVVKKSSSEPDAIAVREFCKKNDLEVRFIHEMDLESGCFTLVEGGDGGNCRNCSRLRLTANGGVKPCLFNNQEFSIHELGIREALVRAINFKPEKGSMNRNDKFHTIGG